MNKEEREEFQELSKSKRGIITKLTALCCQYLRQSGHMSEEASTQKNTTRLIMNQCQYLSETQRNIDNCNKNRRNRAKQILEWIG